MDSNKNTARYKRRLSLFLAVFFVFTLITQNRAVFADDQSMFGEEVASQVENKEWTPADEIKGAYYIDVIAMCFDEAPLTGGRQTSASDIRAGKSWFRGMAFDAPKNLNSSGCGGTIMKTAADFLGINLVDIACNEDKPRLLKPVGDFSTTVKGCKSIWQDSSIDTSAGSNSLKWESNFNDRHKARDTWLEFIGARIYGKTVNSNIYDNLSGPAKYLYYKSIFTKTCGAGSVIESGGYTYKKVAVKDSAEHKIGEIYELHRPKTISEGGSVTVDLWTGASGADVSDRWKEGNNQWTCSKVVQKIYDWADSYSEWVSDHPDIAARVDSEATNSMDDGNNGGSSCNIDGGLGWLLCPIINTAAKIIDGAYQWIIEPFLKVDSETIFRTTPVDVNDDGDFDDEEDLKASPLYIHGFRRILDIANVLLVIAFTVVIFSQIANAGISNYGIKKMLPKLIIVAILMNVSFYLCAIVVDISNILGNGLYKLFLGTDFAMSKPDNSFSDIAGGVLGFTAAGALAWANIGALGVAIMAGLVGVAVGMLALIIRQFGIMVLIIFAPLALLCNVFPNLDQYYKKWQSSFITLLMVYPTIGAVMGLSKFVSAIISTSSDDILGQIAGSLIAILPAVAIPSLCKSSIKGLGELGGKISSALNGLENAGRKRAETGTFGQIKAAQERKKMQNRQLANTGNYKGLNPFLRARSGISGGVLRAGTHLPRGLGGDLATTISAAGIAATNKEEEQSVAERQALYDKNIGTNPSDLRAAYEKVIKSGDSTSAKALSNLLMAQGGKGIEALANAHDTLDSTGLSGKSSAAFDSSKRYLKKDYAKIKEKNAALAKSLDGGTVAGAYAIADTFKGLSTQAFAGQDAVTLTRLNANYASFNADEQLKLSKLANAALSDPKILPQLDPGQIAQLTDLAEQKDIKQATVDLHDEQAEFAPHGVRGSVVETEKQAGLKAGGSAQIYREYLAKKAKLNRMGYSDTSSQVAALQAEYTKKEADLHANIDREVR